MWIGTIIGTVCCLGGAMNNSELDSTTKLYPEVQRYIQERAHEFDQIPADRKRDLKKIVEYVASQKNAGEPARLVFICTHNSRRSHMAQIWAAIAAQNYGVSKVESYSGGTEATAFNPRAVAALRRAGIKIEKMTGDKNPPYAVRVQEQGEPIVAFSKVYTDEPNPKKDFCAIMTCSQADKACPLVRGCSLRVAVPYDDPKAADNTPEEAAKYDERAAQISREMLFLFSELRN